MLISVLMSTYNEPVEYIRASVESILNQTISDFEYIIMVDNPNNIEIINVLHTYQCSDSRIHVFINEKNMGLVGSLNEGLKHCSGQYIVRMDADDISLCNRFEKQLQKITESGLDLISCWNQTFSNSSNGSITKLPLDYRKCVKVLRYYCCIPHPSWFAKKEVFDTCGGYRNIYACEDYDFLVRAALAGYKLGNCGEVLLHYRYNMNSISRTAGAQQILTAKLIAKYYRSGQLLSMRDYENYIASVSYSKARDCLLKYYMLQEKYAASKDRKTRWYLYLKMRMSSIYWKDKAYYIASKLF